MCVFIYLSCFFFSVLCVQAMVKLVAALETLCQSEADRRRFNAEIMARAQTQEATRCTQVLDARKENEEIQAKYKKKNAEAKGLEANTRKFEATLVNSIALMRAIKEENERNKEQMEGYKQQLEMMQSLRARLSDGEAREADMFMETWLRIFCDELSTVWQFTSAGNKGSVIRTVNKMAGVDRHWTWASRAGCHGSTSLQSWNEWVERSIVRTRATGHPLPEVWHYKQALRLFIFVGNAQRHTDVLTCTYLRQSHLWVYELAAKIMRAIYDELLESTRGRNYNDVYPIVRGEKFESVKHVEHFLRCITRAQGH
jgi:hypothetical protein